MAAPRVYVVPTTAHHPIDSAAAFNPLGGDLRDRRARQGFSAKKRSAVYTTSEPRRHRRRGPCTLLVVDSPPTRRTQQVREPALPTLEARPRTAVPLAAARRAPLVTPTYSPPRTLPRGSPRGVFILAHSRLLLRVYATTVARSAVPFCLPRVWQRLRKCARAPFFLSYS